MVLGREVEALEPWTREPSESCKQNVVNITFLAGVLRRMRAVRTMLRRLQGGSKDSRDQRSQMLCTHEQGLHYFLEILRKLSSEGVE